MLAILTLPGLFFLMFVGRLLIVHLSIPLSDCGEALALPQMLLWWFLSRSEFVLP